MRRVQDAEVSSEHETLDPEESKATALREEGDIIVFNANGPLLGNRRGEAVDKPRTQRTFSTAGNSQQQADEGTHWCTSPALKYILKA